MFYIQIAINKVKTLDLEEMKALRKAGRKAIRVRLETVEESKKRRKRNIAIATIPLIWVIESKEHYKVTGNKDEKVFAGFISDWISGWV